MWYALFRILHFIALFSFAGALIMENMATAGKPSRDDIRNLARVDAVAIIALAVTAACGLILWLGVGKPAGFYSSNPVFHVKLALFGLLLIAAFFPFRFFRRQRTAAQDENHQAIAVPARIRLLLRLELVLVVLIIIAAFPLARGIGLSG